MKTIKIIFLITGILTLSWLQAGFSAEKPRETMLFAVYTEKNGRTNHFIPSGWAGIYWQNPENNWGSKDGGFNLSSAKRLTFWARGEKGGETIVRFGMGGIGGVYPDSAKAEIGPVVLKKEWKQYSIDLADKDLTYISGGFYWMTDKISNPEGAIFYID